MTIAVHSRWLATSTLFEHARPLIIPVERLSKHSDGLGYGFHHRGEFRVIDTYPNRYILQLTRSHKSVKCELYSCFLSRQIPPNLGVTPLFQAT